MTATDAPRDGFSVREIDTGDEIHFVASHYSGRMRQRVEMGLLRNTNLDRFFVVDTREES